MSKPTWAEARAYMTDSVLCDSPKCPGCRHTRVAVERADCFDELLAALEHALLYVQNGDFRNGVEEYGKDEGQYRADAFAGELQAIITKAKQGGKP